MYSTERKFSSLTGWQVGMTLTLNYYLKNESDRKVKVLCIFTLLLSFRFELFCVILSPNFITCSRKQSETKTENSFIFIAPFAHKTQLKLLYSTSLKENTKIKKLIKN